MNNYLNEITPEMTKTVYSLIARNFENATPDEIKTYAKWTAILELQKDEIRQIRETRESELEIMRKSSEEQKEKALKTLELLAEKAKANLERANNG